MKEKVQKFGRFLSGMVMPNIGAFIAWGLITALFIETGWCPNEKFATLVDPMSKVMLPLLIAYTGGEVVAGKRGGVIGAIAAMGVIVGSDVPMFIGAMIVGPLSAWVIKKFDKAVDGHIKAGFEMLVNNFSLGIIGFLLALVAMVAITPLVNALTFAMGVGVWLEGDEEEKRRLCSDIGSRDMYDAGNRKERRKRLILEILKEKGLRKLFYYSNQFGVSEATISTDLEAVEKWLNRYGLYVNRKPGSGIAIDGSEECYRKANPGVYP